MEPNKENIQKWVDALRSGKYGQVRYVLKGAKGGYCCLGVACDISGLGEWGEATPYNDGIQYNFSGTTGRQRTLTQLPSPVVDWLGVNFNVWKPKDYDQTLADLNDIARLSFNVIADLIEDEFLT